MDVWAPLLACGVVWLEVSVLQVLTDREENNLPQHLTTQGSTGGTDLASRPGKSVLPNYLCINYVTDQSGLYRISSVNFSLVL